MLGRQRSTHTDKPSAPAAFDLDLPGPLVATGFADQARRARGRTPRVFRQDMDVLSKNPAKPVDPARSAGRNRRGVLSFGYLFFAQAKKSNSLAIASETRDGTGMLSTELAFFAATSRRMASSNRLTNFPHHFTKMHSGEFPSTWTTIELGR